MIRYHIIRVSYLDICPRMASKQISRAALNWWIRQSSSYKRVRHDCGQIATIKDVMRFMYMKGTEEN